MGKKTKHFLRTHKNELVCAGKEKKVIAVRRGRQDGHRIKSRDYYLRLYRRHYKIIARLGPMVPSKTHRKRGATYDTLLIHKGQHCSVVPRIPRASSSTNIPESVKVKMPSLRGEKQNTFCAHTKTCRKRKKKKTKSQWEPWPIFQEWCYRQKQLESEEPPMRD